MNREYTVKTVVNGVEVEAAVIRSKFEFSVKITQPFLGKETCGPHIPFFIRPFHSFENEYGDKRILEVLRSLFDEGKEQSVKNDS